jgi:transposase InsO family protein
VSATYAFIEAEYTTVATETGMAPTVTQMCAWLHVSRSGFYEWRNRPVSPAAARRQKLRKLIRLSFDSSDGTYGHRRICAELARWGHACSPELVRTLMRDLDLVPCQPRPWRWCLTDGADTGRVPDLVARDFTAEVPGEKMVGDITYIPTWEGWLYLATVIDCCTKEIIGYAMGDNYKTPLIEKAIRMAIRNQNIKHDAIFHSDRGSNYMSGHFAMTLKELALRQSTGRTGICWDNAMAESFFGTLKNERVSRTTYPTREHARRDIARYIEFHYNTKRLHSGLGYRTPREVRDEHLNRQDMA